MSVIWQLKMKWLIYITLFSYCGLWSQKTIDLRYEPLDSLYPKAVEFWRMDSDSVYPYGDELLRRARLSGIPSRYIHAYHILSLITLGKESQNFTDSLYQLAKSTKDAKYVATALFLKGRNAYDAGQYKSSLDEYLKCNELLRHDVDSVRLENLVRDNIGLIRILVGDNDGAVKIYRDLLRYYGERDNSGQKYLWALFSLAVAHHQNGDFSVSQQLVHKGLGLLEGTENGPIPYFLSVYGANHYGMGDYQTAIANLHKANTSFKKQEDAMRQAIAHYYLGSAHHALGNTDSTLYHMQRVDAIYEKDPKSLYPLTRGAWEYLLGTVRENGDTEAELRYISKLLAIDSIISGNFRYVNLNLTQKYDMPRLVSERNALVNRYRSRNRHYLMGLAILSIVLLTFFIFRKRRSKDPVAKISAENNGTGNKVRQSSKMTISPHKLSTIADGLADLEGERFHLELGITVKKTARLLGVGEKQLSIYLNRHVGMTFTQYVNGLRVEHFRNRLRSDSDFVKTYTLDAMAQECGFKNNKSLSKVCKRRLGKTSSELVRESRNPLF
ncbi:helix-turn-helix domain-containing protein [Flagellimonas nanhaiensis]|uniref:Helix-turn-helix domain-containing protein n=1 Tax=Flagellimonas nanhaiensis TaxID=2292706 RepID=A0A371JLN2_9FLAO|nr:helix-turn-helix domain-containing protein [Allomuricauda nanhaiensis]RDY57904.1 helix-turn-helix domain-containing protein [Allomuricauda nanhaiensis]